MARLKPEEQKKVAEKIIEGAKSFVDAKRLIKKDKIVEKTESDFSKSTNRISQINPKRREGNLFCSKPCINTNH